MSSKSRSFLSRAQTMVRRKSSSAGSAPQLERTWSSPQFPSTTGGNEPSYYAGRYGRNEQYYYAGRDNDTDSSSSASVRSWRAEDGPTVCKSIKKSFISGKLWARTWLYRAQRDTPDKIRSACSGMTRRLTERHHRDSRTATFSTQWT